MNIWLPHATIIESPNQDLRPVEESVDLLVIHNISLPPNQFGGNGIQQLFLNQLDPTEHEYYEHIYQLRVSSHLLINRQGKLTQFVPLNKRAWHAGQSVFDGRPNCNDYSIGIELEGCDDIQYTDEQYQQLVETTKSIQSYFPHITKQRITGHCDIAPERKTDPGKAFEWKRYLDSI